MKKYTSWLLTIYSVKLLNHARFESTSIFTALASKEHGIVHTISVQAYAPFTAVDIIELLIRKDLASGETAIILLFRYVLFVDTKQHFVRVKSINKSHFLVLQNNCGNKTGNFQVITENIPCGTTGTTCSKNVKILLGVRVQA